MKFEFTKGSRSQVLAVIIIAIAIVFVLRLFYLQVIRHDYYVAQADREHLRHLTIPAKRGMIYAMDGNATAPLVMNETVYTVFADPEIIEDTSEVVSTLREVAGGNTRPNFEELVARDDTRYQVLATKLSRTQAEKIREKRLVGIGFHEESQRVYPEGALAGQVLGFVDGEGQGRYGIESGLNDRLTGKDGLLQTVTDVRDVPLTIGDRNINQPAEDGDDIVLSIDRNVQAAAEQALEKAVEDTEVETASAIVINPNNGRVIAMANSPGYNPGQFSNVDDASLFNNVIVSEPYEPASVIKTFALAAGIDTGVITPESTYNNTDSVRVYDRTITNAYRGLTGTRTMQEVLNNSLNTGTVEIAMRLGDGENINRQARDTMYEYYHERFGLGKTTGIEVSGEQAGLVWSPDEQEGNAVRYSNMTFGQGLDVTTLQVAAGFSAMINGGTFYQPTVLQGVREENGTIREDEPEVVRDSVVSSETSATMRDMIHQARQSVSWMRDQDPGGYVIGGKTGTAETLQGSYTKDETVASYVGFGGGERPEYVIMVRASAEGQMLQGGLHASPIFTDISNYLIDYLRVEPRR